MIILYLLIPISLLFLSIAVWAFFWAVKNNQFDDLEGPAYRILFDEDENDLSPEERQRRRQNAEAAHRRQQQGFDQPPGGETRTDVADTPESKPDTEHPQQQRDTP